MKNIHEEILSIINSNKNAALCIVVSTRGSTPRKPGSKMIVYEDCKISGTIGGSELEKKVIENAINVIKTKKPNLSKHDLLHHGMCCGGSVEIYIEPIMNKKKLYIFGAGHTGQSLAKFAREFDFNIVLIDDRKEYLDEFQIDDVSKLNLEHSVALKSLPFDSDTFIVILTYSHQMDRDILSYCIKEPFAYLGMIGSKRKIEMTKKMFIEGKIGTAEELATVNMPIGIDINADSPDEIAISILAEMIKVKNKVIKQNITN